MCHNYDVKKSIIHTLSILFHRSITDQHTELEKSYLTQIDNIVASQIVRAMPTVRTKQLQLVL